MGSYFPEATPELQQLVLEQYLENLSLKDLEKLQRDTHEWAIKTFGECHYRAQVIKLKEEVDELNEVDENHIGEELADCLLLLLDIAMRTGVSVRPLLWEAKKKHVVNKTSKWRKRDIVGRYVMYERVREEVGKRIWRGNEP